MAAVHRYTDLSKYGMFIACLHGGETIRYIYPQIFNIWIPTNIYYPTAFKWLVRMLVAFCYAFAWVHLIVASPGADD